MEDIFNQKNFGEQMLAALGYKINRRRLSDIKPLFSDDYKKMGYRFNGDSCSDAEVAYIGAEHSGNPKLPNLTVIQNLTCLLGKAMGSTMGHQHLQAKESDERELQELYEFHGYGAMLIRGKYGTRMHVLKPGEKVGVGTGDSMAIINLGESELVTFDYANPKKNSASKETEKRIGTMMLVRQTEEGMLFEANKKYYDENLVQGEADARQILVRAASPGTELYKKIADYSGDFRRAGIQLSFGTSVPSSLRKASSLSLLELIISKNRALFEALQMPKGGIPQ